MKFSSIAKLNLMIVALCVTMILLGGVVGLIPDERNIQVKYRTQTCEVLAANLIGLGNDGELDAANSQINEIVRRVEEIESVGIRKSDGTLAAASPQHEQRWRDGLSAKNDGCYVVPIDVNGQNWGRVEFRYPPLYSGMSLFVSPGMANFLLMFIPGIGITLWFYLRRVMHYLDPSRVVPSRVRQTLDSFVEGVVLLDRKGAIVLANQAFREATGENDLVGKEIDSLPWKLDSNGQEELPWQRLAKTHQSINAQTVHLRLNGSSDSRIFSVNASPVKDETGRFRGTMVAFADVTVLEENRIELASTLEVLEESRLAITHQNEELRFLATRDPLTGCLNRRTFYEQFHTLWKRSHENGQALCALMVDIDFFKSINDNYGHAMGDEVLRKTAELLSSLAREQDVVCRYGGEEFSVLIPELHIEQAAARAEQMCEGLRGLEFDGFSITASIGVSEVGLGATDTADLLDQADKCLYYAKRHGRDQVVRFDTLPADVIVDESKIDRVKPSDQADATIPFSAVSALLSALSYRDVQTGAHSVRVSNLAARLAQRLMGPKDAYVVEIAGLLHDIGKIGVADAILLKPGKLSEKEWEHMRKHDLIGVDLVRKAFKNQKLSEMIRSHHARFDGASAHKNLPAGTSIPLGARILTIADSFDAMVSNRPYRKGMQVADAIAELRRCSGTQFDPGLVEQFIETIESGGAEPDVSSGVVDEIVLSLGEQIESIVAAVDAADRDTFVALTERLKQTAEQCNVSEVSSAAARAVEAASEDCELKELAEHSFELLTTCRAIHTIDAIKPAMADCS